VVKRRCALCGAPVIGKQRNAIYCGGKCRRDAYNRRVRHGAPDDDEETEAGRLEVRRRLAAASRVDRWCRCSNPLGLVDEDGEARCFRCGWPLVRTQVSELPPAA
jgi:endogenous inhibitor of DNA gyrase (YacG/DUF329 family)